MPKKKEVEPPAMKEELTLHCADHEVWLAFNGDDEAIAFREWWDSEGFAEFRYWEKNR